jgi:mannose-6-phosphate isomerase-like protein (cupin superfamily)
MPARPIVLDVDGDLASGTTAQQFEGAVHGGGVGVSFFLNHTPPGRVVSPHRHAYGEVFVIADGEAEFVVDGVAATARGGQVLVVPAGAVHGFRNTGARTLEMTSIHAAAAMETEWLDESG